MSGVRRPGRSDGADAILAGAVRLLPASKQAWGRAMRSELATIGERPARRRFVAGCTLAVLKRPGWSAALGATLLVVMVAAAASATTATAYWPLRISLILMAVAVGLLMVLVPHVPVLSGPPSDSPVPTAIRSGGAVLVTGLVIGVAAGLGTSGGDAVDRTMSGVPLFTTVFLGYVLGLNALTSAVVTPPAPLAVAVALGSGVGAGWLALAVARPPLPASAGSAIVALGVAMLMGGALGSRWGAAWSSTLVAGVVGALTIVVLGHLALRFGPAGWVPPHSAALTPSARLAQSRSEVGDALLPVLLLGALLAGCGTLLAWRQHHSRSPATVSDPAPVTAA